MAHHWKNLYTPVLLPGANFAENKWVSWLEIRFFFFALLFPLVCIHPVLIVWSIHVQNSFDNEIKQLIVTYFTLRQKSKLTGNFKKYKTKQIPKNNIL